MSDEKAVDRRVKELERRVKELEAAPREQHVHITYPPLTIPEWTYRPYPWAPYPYYGTPYITPYTITCGTTSVSGNTTPADPSWKVTATNGLINGSGGTC